MKTEIITIGDPPEDWPANAIEAQLENIWKSINIFKENPALNSVTLTAPVNYPLSSHYINFPNGKKVRILEVLPVF